MKYTALIFSIFLFISCKEQQPAQKEWVLQSSPTIEGVNPIGITLLNNELWLSDGDHNRLVRINDEGIIDKIVDSLERPMHIDSDNRTLYNSLVWRR